MSTDLLFSAAEDDIAIRPVPVNTAEKVINQVFGLFIALNDALQYLTYFMLHSLHPFNLKYKRYSGV